MDYSYELFPQLNTGADRLREQHTYNNHLLGGSNQQRGYYQQQPNNDNNICYYQQHQQPASTFNAEETLFSASNNTGITTAPPAYNDNNSFLQEINPHQEQQPFQSSFCCTVNSANGESPVSMRSDTITNSRQSQAYSYYIYEDNTSSSSTSSNDSTNSTRNMLESNMTVIPANNEVCKTNVQSNNNFTSNIIDNMSPIPQFSADFINHNNLFVSSITSNTVQHTADKIYIKGEPLTPVRQHQQLILVSPCSSNQSSPLLTSDDEVEEEEEEEDNDHYVQKASTSVTSSKRKSTKGSSSYNSSSLYHCEYEGCIKTFTRTYNLKSHRRTHTDEKPFVCSMCPKAFARQHDRNRHAKLHLGLKPYPCQYCDKPFARQDALNRHLKRDKKNLVMSKKNNSSRLLQLSDGTVLNQDWVSTPPCLLVKLRQQQKKNGLVKQQQ